jgi:hypothetical protein
VIWLKVKVLPFIEKETFPDSSKSRALASESSDRVAVLSAAISVPSEEILAELLVLEFLASCLTIVELPKEAVSEFSL